MTARRNSPLAHALASLHPEWMDVSGMAIPATLPDEPAERVVTLGICDVSALRRLGVKGPAAGQWLADRGVPVPASPNAWCDGGQGGLVARLARTEFLVEDGFAGGDVARLSTELKAGTAGVYPVPRQDCALLLTGARVGELLVQTCNVDFSAQDPLARPVTLTQMVGVSVVVLRSVVGAVQGWRLWCDGTSGPYLWETLCGIAQELGGGPVGLRSAVPDTKT